MKYGLLSSVAIVPLVLFSTPSLAQDSAEADGGDVSETAAESEDDNVIVVSGTRASLSASLNQKRQAAGVVDAINADDIGKFPDLNIGESLARISGVTISRSPGGEGSRVSVRGGQTDWTNVTVNGLAVATGGVGREFDFDIFASELFSNARVFKSPSADTPEGGLTATIDLRTPQPFDLGDRAAFSVSASDYAKGNGDLQPRVTGLISRTFAEERFGVLLSASYSKTAARADLVQGWGWDDNNRGLETYLSGFTQADAPTILINGEPVNDLAELQDIAANTITPELPRLGPQLIERERLGLTGAVQFQATDNLELFADVLFADFSQNEIRATIDGIPGFNIGREWTSITINDDGVAIGGTIQNQSQRSETLHRQVDTQLWHITTGTEWQISDVWDAGLTLGYSKADEDELSRTYLWDYTGEFSYDFSNRFYPDLQGADWLDPSVFVSQQTRFRPFQRQDEEFSISADVGAEFDDSMLRGIRVGIQYRDRDKGQTRLAELREPFSASLAEYGVLASDLFGSSYHDASPFRADFYLADVVAAGRDLLPSDLSITTIDELQTYTVGEKTLAAFFKADIGFDIGAVPVSIDTGVRFVKTDVNSQGFQQEATGPEPVAIPGSYNDWLPALNIKADLSDRFVLRLAANRTMTRPPLADIAPAVSISPTVLSARRGNPGLLPFRSNNIDLSLEWYFAPEALLSATAYYKDVESFIVRETRPEIVVCGDIRNDSGENVCGQEFQVTTPVNGESGKLYGIELQYQQPFTFLPEPFDGLGMLLNATFSKSERTDDLGVTKTLPGQSDTSFNIVGYYEKGPVGLRAAYNYRSSFAVGGRNGFEDITDAYGQFDVSARFSVTDNFEVFFEGLNLFEENSYTYQALTAADGTVNDFGKALNDTYLTQGRVLQLGIRGNF